MKNTVLKKKKKRKKQAQKKKKNKKETKKKRCLGNYQVISSFFSTSARVSICPKDGDKMPKIYCFLQAYV